MTLARPRSVLAAVLTLTVLAVPCAAAQSAAAVVRVPHGRAVPVLVDGRFSPDEWDDADTVALAGSLVLLVKQVEGHVFLAVVTGAPNAIDLYLQDGSGRVHQLHASAQLGERALRDTSWGDTVPRWRWGNHVDWIANEAKIDPTLDTGLPFPSRLHPADGTEFQIRRSRFHGDRWRIRLDVRQFVAGAPVQVWPLGATRDPATWATVTLD